MKLLGLGHATLLSAPGFRVSYMMIRRRGGEGRVPSNPNVEGHTHCVNIYVYNRKFTTLKGCFSYCLNLNC